MNLRCTYHPALININLGPVFDLIHPFISLKQILGIVSYVSILVVQFYLLTFWNSVCFMLMDHKILGLEGSLKLGFKSTLLPSGRHPPSEFPEQQLPSP